MSILRYIKTKGYKDLLPVSTSVYGNEIHGKLYLGHNGILAPVYGFKKGEPPILVDNVKREVNGYGSIAEDAFLVIDYKLERTFVDFKLEVTLGIIAPPRSYISRQTEVLQVDLFDDSYKNTEEGVYKQIESVFKEITDIKDFYPVLNKWIEKQKKGDV